MAKHGDEVKVGVMVIGAGAILTIAVFMMMHYNPFQPSNDQYKINLKFAGGLEKDSIVRFGGMRKGKVTAVRLAPDNSSIVEIALSLEKGTPVRIDSVARLAALSALGDNYIEITPGRNDTPLLKPGQMIRSEETPAFSEILAQVNSLSGNARKLMDDLDRNINRISDGADTLMSNLNDVTGVKNRQMFASILDRTNGMISNANDLIVRSGPKIDAVTSNLQATSDKLTPLLEHIDDAASKMNTLLENFNGTLAENRPQINKDLKALESTLSDAKSLLVDLSGTLNSNRDEIDSILENFRRSSENLQEFTNTVKQRPFSLIRVKPRPSRQVPK